MRMKSNSSNCLRVSIKDPFPKSCLPVLPLFLLCVKRSYAVQRQIGK